MGSQSENDP